MGPGGNWEPSRRTVLAGTAAALAGGAIPHVAAGADRETAAFASFFDDLVPAQLDRHAIAGATVAVVADGNVQFAAGYGEADADAGEPVDADTPFRVGSVAKTLTGAVVMHAAEHGVVDLDADVRTYLESVEIPATDEPITLRQLCTHAAGFEERLEGTYHFDATTLPNLPDYLAAAQPGIVRGPNTLASYSNYGWALAGQVVADAAGTTFTDYAREHVLEPLGMDDASYDRPENAASVPQGHVRENDRPVPADPEFIPAAPAGSLRASARDAAQLLKLLVGDGVVDGERILAADSVDAMLTPQFRNHPAINGVGIGTYELRNDELWLVGHSGDTQHFATLLVVAPERNLGMFVSYNTAGAAAARQRLFDAFVDRFFTAPGPEPIEPEPPTDAEAISGWYRITRVNQTGYERVLFLPSLINVEVQADGTLRTDPVGAGVEPQTWVETEPYVFRSTNGHERLAFVTRDGEVSHLVMDNAPTLGFRKLSRGEDPLLQFGAFILASLVVVGTIAGWGLAGAYRALGRGGVVVDRPTISRVTVAAAASALFLPLVTMGAILAADPNRLATGMPWWYPATPFVGTVGLAIAFLAVGMTWHVWREGWWARWSRMLHTVVTLAVLVVAWLLVDWNLVWFPG